MLPPTKPEPELTGRKAGNRGRNPRSLENLKRTREKLSGVPRSSNSAEHMAKARAAKAAKRNVTVVQTVEIAPVTNGGTVTPVGHANVRPVQAWPGQGRGDLPAPVSSSPSSPPKPETWVDVPVIKRSAPHWEVVCYPNGYSARRRIGSVEVVRVHVGDRDRYWAPDVDKLLDEEQLDPLPGPCLPATSQKETDEARALERRQWQAGGRSTAGSWLPTHREEVTPPSLGRYVSGAMRDLIDRGA